MKKFLIKELYLPVIYIIVGYIIYKLLKWIVLKAFSKKQENLAKKSYNYKRIETFKNLFVNIVKWTVVIITGLSILPVFGIDISSVLAGLGIASAALALAFQDVLKDFIAGVSIILENQFALGDTISIGGFKGEVVQMGLKSTRIRNYQGEIKILANRNITEVINYSNSYSLAIVDISVSYEDNVEKVEKVLNELAEELTNSLTKLKGPVEVLGIENLADSSVVFRITAKTNALEHFGIQREIRKAVKLRLDKEKIKIPYPQIEVHNGK